MIDTRLTRGPSGDGRSRFSSSFLTANAAVLLLAASVVPSFAVDMPNACDVTFDPKKPFEISVTSEINTDYIYRGVTLSAHQPSVGVSVEVDSGPFYVAFQPHSVKLPTNPAAELGFSAGFCKQIFTDVKFDVGVSYLYYTGEMSVPPVTSTSYAEGHASVSVDTIKPLTLSAMYAYSPNYSNTGAWEHYLEGSVEIHLDKVFPGLLPKQVEWSLTGTVGRSWFGTQSADLGGFPLPSYTNWSLGLSFEYAPFTFELAYSNTNLSKENCFVFTGDPNAAPGGAIDVVTNPAGLRSNWCGAALVGTLTIDLSPK